MRLGQLGRVLGYDAGEARQRQRDVVIGRNALGGRRLSCCVARLAGIRPHQQREDAEHGNEEAEQQRADLGDHGGLGLDRRWTVVL